MAERHRSRGRIVMAALACAVSMLLLAFFVPAGHAATTDSQKFRDVARQEGLDIEEATVSECADALQGMGATEIRTAPSRPRTSGRRPISSPR